MRNIDMTALRSFVAVADAGGVTKAAGFLHLTQSAVSMQLKRLEEMLGTQLLDRSARQVALTNEGELLLSYARRILELNDDIYSKMTSTDYEGELILGVPHDVVYPAIPMVLQRFNALYPRMRVQLISSYTAKLKELFSQGKCDLILTTEDSCDADGETLIEIPLIWFGAVNGSAWKTRPLRLAYENRCAFRRTVQAALDAAGIPWEMAVDSASSRAIEVSVSADLAINAQLQGTQPDHLQAIQHGGALPALGTKKINLYLPELRGGEVLIALSDIIRQCYAQRAPVALRA